MKERIAFAPWGFIQIKCAEHKEDLILVSANGKPNYCCPHSGCSLHVSDLVYEKMLEETVTLLNSNKLAIGSKWGKRIAGKTYEFFVLSAAEGKRPEIGVKTNG